MAKFDTPLNVFDRKIYSAWVAKIESYDLENNDSAIKKMISALYHAEPCFVIKRFSGSYNLCFQIRFEGGREDMLLRFPIHGVVMNPQKKVEDEALVMRFIKEKTEIPIPNYYTHGIASGEFDGLGPFILIEFIPGQRLDELLCSGDEFKPIVTEPQLNKVYEQIATIYLQL
jgi:aminoglycoside phosphotransferase (APT) family kinase protein